MQVTRLLEAQLKVVGEERKALVEQERQSIQRLLTTISASVNRDLPKRIEEITVREVAAVSAMVAQAVEDAVARTLSKELLGASVRVGHPLASSPTRRLLNCCFNACRRLSRTTPCLRSYWAPP